MATSEVITATVPEHLLALNEHVRRFGIDASVRHVAIGEDLAPVLQVTWIGQVDALYAARVVLPSWHVLRKATFEFPRREHSLSRRQVEGDITVEGRQFRMVAVQPVPQITRIGAAEILGYPDMTVYFGASEELVRLNLCSPDQLPGPKKASKSQYAGSLDPWWFSRRTMDGRYLVYVEPDDARLARLQAEVEFWEECDDQVALFGCGFKEDRDKRRAEILGRARAALSVAHALVSARSDPAFKAFIASTISQPPGG